VCHQGSGAVEAWDRSNGRIYRIVYDKLKPWKGDIGKLSDQDLKKMAVENGNVWFQRMARKVLWERYAGKRPPDALMQGLSNLAITKPSSSASLRALWTLDSLYEMAAKGEYGDWSVLYEQILDESDADYQRGWAVRLAGNETAMPSREMLADFSESAKKEKSPLVRRELASLLQRLPLDKRTDIALALIRHKEDAEDAVIPYLIWYGVEPVVGADAKAGLKLAAASQMDMVTGFIYRRMSADDAGRNALLSMAATLSDAAQREKTLAMIVESARNTGRHKMPKDWNSVSAKLREGASPGMQLLVDEMSALFGDEATLKKLRDILSDTHTDFGTREHALTILVQIHDLPTAKILQGIVSLHPQPDPLRRKAIQSLVALPDSGNAAVLTQCYASLSADEKSDAVSALASTRSGATALLRGVGDKKIEAQMLTPFLVRQLQALKDRDVDALITQVYGTVNQAKPDVAVQKKKWQKLLSAAVLKAADVKKGHEIFKGTCATCHRLMGEGASVGPDLTGSNRADLGYLLDNVLDPSAVIGKGYELNVFTMKDGRVLSGIMKEETSAGYKVAMPGGVELVLNKSEVSKREMLKISMMPEGQFDALGPEMAANLVAFLQSNAPKTGALTGMPAIKVEGAMEGEGMKVLGVTGGATKPQGMGNFRASRWSGGSQLWWTGAKPGAVLTLALPVAVSGNYSLKAVLTKARDYGVAAVSLDGKPVPNGEQDFYNFPDVVTSGELDWGMHLLEAGEHKLEVKITGANPAAVKGYMFGLDYVKLEKK
jgi:putative heme-binding domain-containing protein